MSVKFVVSVVLSLVIGVSGGYVIANYGEEDDAVATQDTIQHEHSDDETMPESDDHSEMSHGMYEVEAANAPSVTVAAEEDAVSGWNVTLTTENFTFTPENVNDENIANEGHAHLYVDGKKVARLYGSTFHYSEPFDGTKTFKVILNANDHSEYAIDGVVISDSIEVTHTAHN